MTQSPDSIFAELLYRLAAVRGFCDQRHVRLIGDQDWQAVVVDKGTIGAQPG